VNEHGQALFDALAIAVPAWASRICAARGVDAGGVGPAAWAVVAGPLAVSLDLDLPVPQPNPLAVLRRAVSAPTSVLRAAGVALPARDEFSIRRSPDDVYDIEPATWSDFGDEVHELGIVWGAAKTMQHLRR
jgi:hypothetical protein